MRINSSLSKLSTKQVKRITRIIIDWCFDHLGENKRIHKDLKVVLDFKTDEKVYCADYDIDDDERLITIYMNMTKTVKDLIQNCLHEYQHDLQPNSTYEKLYKRYGYKNHPHEKEARKIEERFWAICWEDIKSRVDKAIDKR